MLNPIIITALQKQDKEYLVKDIGGLFLKVKKNGIKTFTCDFILNGQRYKKTIGNYPDISIKDARELLQKYKEKVALEQHQNAEINTNITFNKAYKMWRERKVQQVTPKTMQYLTSRAERFLLPKLKNIHIKDIKAPLLIEVVQHLTDKFDTLRRTVMLANEILNMCVFSGYLDYNPCENVIKTFQKKTYTQNRYAIHYADLYKLKPLIEKMPFSPRLFFLFSLASLLRPKENTELKWDYIDFKKKIIIIPAEVMKMRRDHRVPLTPFMIEILQNQQAVLKALNVNCPYVWYSFKAKEGHYSTNTLSKFLRENGYDKTLTPHGFRSVGRTFMADKNVTHEVAEACLAHVEGGVVRIYQRSDFLEKRREAMQLWSDYICEQLEVKL